MPAPHNDDDALKSRESDWKGFAEVDRAIAENRLTEYRWRKAWADPWNRRIIIVVMIIFVAFATFVAIAEATAR